MKYLAEKNNLELGKDVKQIIMSNTTLAVKEYLENNQNKTWYGAIFCTSQWDDGVTSNLTLPCRPRNLEPGAPEINLYFYSIMYNFTLMPSFFLDNFTAPTNIEPTMLRIKNSIDSGILDYVSRNKSQGETYGLEFEDEMEDFKDDTTLHIETTWSNFPLTASRVFHNADISSMVGSFYFSMGPLVTFVVILTEIVKEKQLKLRQGLSVVGLSHTSYWMHWLITSMFFATVVSLTTIIAGLILQFKLFFNANIIILFMLFFIFTMSLV